MSLADPHPACTVSWTVNQTENISYTFTGTAAESPTGARLSGQWTETDSWTTTQYTGQWGAWAETTPIAPANGANTSDQPTFSWTAIQAANQPVSYQIRLFQPATPLINVGTATSYTLPASLALTPGTFYSWTVSAVGTFSYDFISDFKVAPLAQATPAGVGSQTIPGPTIGTDQPTFSWTTGSGTAPGSYEIWLRDDTTARTAYFTGLTGSSYALPPSQAFTPGDNYEWAIASISTTGKVTSWNNDTILHFTVGTLPAPMPLSPGTQDTTSPPVNTETPTFSWTAAAGVQPGSYDLWLGDLTLHQANPEAAWAATVMNLSGAWYTVPTSQPLTPGHTYEWTVAAVSTNGRVTTWNEGVLTFTLTNLALPLPASPGDASSPGITLGTDQPTFSWSTGSGIAAGSYDIWLADVNIHQVHLLTTLTGTSYTLPASQALAPGHSYEWEMAAVSTNGQAIGWNNATTLYFTIGSLAVATPDSPGVSDSSFPTLSTDLPTFSWTTGTGVTPASYDIWLYNQTAHSASVVDAGGGSSFTLPPARALTPGDSYQWEIASVSNRGLVSWDNDVVFSFTVAAMASVAPVGPGSADAGTTLLSTDRPTFSWSVSSGVAPGSYELWLYDQNTHQASLVPAGTGTSFTLPAAQGLTPGHSYSWTVAAISNNGRLTNWNNDTVLTFAVDTLGPPTPASPGVSSGPASTLMTDRPTFSWTAGAGLTPGSYAIWLGDLTIHAANPAAAWTRYLANLSGTSYTPTADQALIPGHTYEWAIGAFSSNGQAANWNNDTFLSFSVAPMTTATPVSPTGQSTTAQPTFSWSVGSGTPPGSFEIWLGDTTVHNTNAKAPWVTYLTNLTGTSYSLPASQALVHGHAYQWFIAAVSSNGQVVNWNNSAWLYFFVT